MAVVAAAGRLVPGGLRQNSVSMNAKDGLDIPASIVWQFVIAYSKRSCMTSTLE